MTQQVKYEIVIERKKRVFPEAKYNWSVKPYMEMKGIDWSGQATTEEKSDYSLQGDGRAYTLARAKKKAIRHILSVEKDVNKGVSFGAVFIIEKAIAKEAIEKLK